jgi:uncharacterized repeat protein (TIGR01451 family)
VTGSGWDCGFETGDVVCTRALLGVTSAPSIILQVHAPLVVGDILNSVSVFTGTDPTPGTDDETTTVAPAPSADLAITKTDGDGTAGWGEPLAFTIPVTNAGPDAVAGATVADDFPAALLAVSWDCVASAGSSCTASGTSDISDASVSLAAGGTVIYKATGTVALETPTPLLNTATVAPPAGVADPNLANNTASVDTTVTEPPGIIFYDDFESGDTSAWSSTVGVEPP